MAQGSHEKKILNAKYGRNKILKAIDEYQMDKLFEQMLRLGTDLKECPGCGAVIEKFEGCNKMKCSECLTCFASIAELKLITVIITLLILDLLVTSYYFWDARN